MTTELIYMLTTLWPTKNGQANEVDADKELERALLDRPEGNDMKKSNSDTSKDCSAWRVFTIFAHSSISH